MKIHLAHTLHRLSIRRLAGMVLMAVAAMTLGGATAAAQNTQVTLEGIITSVGSTPGIALAINTAWSFTTTRHRHHPP
jgi:hypothetical protein